MGRMLAVLISLYLSRHAARLSVSRKRFSVSRPLSRYLMRRKMIFAWSSELAQQKPSML